MIKQLHLFSLKPLLFIALVFCLTACGNNTTVQKADYATEIVGSWQGVVGELNETMTLKSDGTFVCKLQPTGFLATTFREKTSGTIYGNWTIKGDDIQLQVTGEKNEQVKNRSTSSTITTFKENSLTLKSDGGEITTFERVKVR